MIIIIINNKANAANWHRRNTRQDTTGRARWSTGKCARNLNLTMPTNGICTTQHLSQNDTHKQMGLWHTNWSPNPGQKTRSYNNQQKKPCKIVDFAVPDEHRIKLKECEKGDKYLDLARELKNLWTMNVTIIPVVIGAFGTVT